MRMSWTTLRPSILTESAIGSTRKRLKRLFRLASRTAAVKPLRSLTAFWAAPQKLCLRYFAVDNSRLTNQDIVWQRALVVIASRLHLRHQLGMAHMEAFRLEQSIAQVSIHRSAFVDRADKHMMLNMLSEEMLPAHNPRVHHPLPHFNSP